jgi:PilZ domain
MDRERERRYRRFPLVCPVCVRFQGANTATEVETISQNVSLGGLLVKSAGMIPEHTSVTFTARLQVEQAVHPLYLAGEGKIVRVEGSRNGATFWIAIECTPPITQLERDLPLA